MRRVIACSVAAIILASFVLNVVATAASQPDPSALGPVLPPGGPTPDSDGDGYIDALEISLGEDPNTYCAIMRADVDGDGTVTIGDLGTIAAAFLQAVPPSPARLDQFVDSTISIQDLSTAAGNFMLAVSSCPSPATPGVWTNVTPAGFNPNPNYPRAGDNYGFQQVLVDPVRPSDLYVFTNYQGVWKSVDYGLTWVKVSIGANSNVINAGRNWAAVIDPNTSRNPATPPTLYTQAGYSTIGVMGIWKSVDGGVNWTNAWTTVFAANGTTNITSQVWIDMQGLAIDPNNSQHLLAVNHGNTVGSAYDHHIFETTNGGQTWRDRGNPAGTTHTAVAFITSTTWIAVAEGWGPGSPGTFVTTNSGTSWTNVGQYGKAHGNVQVTFKTANGTVYLAAMDGMYRATSPYLSWTRVDTTPLQSVIGTPNFLYASYGWASLGSLPPALRRAPAATGTGWSGSYTQTPAAMTNGAMGAAVTFNATTGKYIIVTGNWLGGLWRYIE